MPKLDEYRVALEKGVELASRLEQVLVSKTFVASEGVFAIDSDKWEDPDLCAAVKAAVVNMMRTRVRNAAREIKSLSETDLEV
jgi:hypothetical protein